MAGFGTQPFGTSAFGGTNPSGSIASAPKVRDTVTSRKHAVRAVSSTPKVRDTATVTARHAGTVTSAPKVRCTINAGVSARAGAAVTSTVVVPDTVVGKLPATRIYLPSSGAAAISPAYSAEWDDTTNAAARLAAVRTPSATAMVTVAAAETGGSTGNNRDLLIRQYVTDPVAAQTIAGNLKGQIQARESNSGANFRGQVIVRVVSNDGTVVRGTLFPGDLRTAITAEWTTTLRSQRVPATGTFPPFDVTPVATQAGDRLVIELGARAQNIVTANYTGEYRFGDNAASDLAPGGAETVDLNPWFELSHVVAWILTRATSSKVTVTDTAAGIKHPAAGLTSAPKVRDTVTALARRSRAISTIVPVRDTAAGRKHPAAGISTTPKVRDTVTARKQSSGNPPSSTPKVRDVVVSRKHVARTLSTAPKVRDTVTTRKRSGATAAEAVTVADTVTVRKRTSGSAADAVTVADTITAIRRSGAALAARVTVADFIDPESHSRRNGTPPSSTPKVRDTVTGGPRASGVLITNVRAVDTVNAGTGHRAGAVSTTVHVIETILSSGAVRIPADITSRVAVADTVVVATSTFRDITVTAQLETTAMYRASREFLRVLFAADVNLDQAVDLQLTTTRPTRTSRRRVTPPVTAGWEPAQWVGEPATTRRARLLYDAPGRGTRPGVYAVHARLADRPESLVFVTVGYLKIT